MENLSFLEKLKEHINETKGFSHEACDFSVFEFENIKKLNDFLRKVENEHMSVFSKDKKSTIIRVVHHCYNYLLQLGGDNVETVWWKNDKEIYRTCIPEKKWHKLDISIEHSIENIETERIAITVFKSERSSI